MLRLGGDTITSADPATSSAAKGESLADSVRVIANYADVIVIRHPRDGAARLAAEYSPIPVINGGDGSHEHPTQTLCDLFTLKKKNKHLKNLKVAISGDLKGSRTIHSFVYALARFGAIIMPMPANGHGAAGACRPAPARGIRLPDRPGAQGRRRRRLDRRALCDARRAAPAVAVLRTRDRLLDAAVAEKKIDAVYVTRFQKERWAEKDQAYPKIDAKFLNEPKYSQASVLHPLPRVGELDAALDSDSRAVYFQQAAYGVPVRMALISLLLGLNKGKSLHKFEGGFDKPKYPLYDQPRSLGIRCANKNCIVHEPMEAQYVRNKFHVVKTETPARLHARCFYCESDIEISWSRTRRTNGSPRMPRRAASTRAEPEGLIVFADEADASAAGFHFKRRSVGANAPQPEGVKSNL